MNIYQRFRERMAPLEIVVDIIALSIIMYLCKCLIQLFPFGAMLVMYSLLWFNYLDKIMSYKGTRLDKGEKE